MSSYDVARAGGPNCSKLFLLRMGVPGTVPDIHFFPTVTEVAYG